MKKTYQILMLFLFLFSTLALAEGLTPFTAHVQEALKINKERLSVYSKLSNRKSVKVSLSLIAMEEALLPLARVLDFRAKKYLKKGVPLLEKEIVPMTLPPFKNEREELTLPIVKLDYSQLMEELSLALKSQDYADLFFISNRFIQELARSPKTNCLTRHFLESIRRAAYYAPYQISLSEHKKLESPKNIIRDFVALHFLGLGWAKVIDSMAIETQEMGIPIICQDIPDIPAK